MSLLNYITGLRKGKDAHCTEVEAMRDPFLAEAIEGYNSVAGDHASRIAGMQKQISGRSRQRKTAFWLSSACSVAAVALFIIYLTVWNKPYGAGYADTEILYVYLPEDYDMEKKVLDYNLPPNVEVEDDLFAQVVEVDIYVPEDYVEKKKRESRNNENAGSMDEKQLPVTISNLDELFAPDEPIDIYLPEVYESKEKQTATPKVKIDNILY
ncbi:hypothetical protein [Viscerimonas tarda]